MTQILIFGDSISWGACDSKGGWTVRLGNYLNKLSTDEKDFEVFNLGVSGNKTDDLLKRFDAETKARLSEYECDLLFIFAIGVNDSQFVKSKNDFRNPINVFERNVLSLIEKAKKHSGKIILVGLTPVNEAKTTPIPWNKDKFYLNKHILNYDLILLSIAAKNNLPFVSVYDKLKKDSMFWKDGLHPQDKGHKIIFDEVKKMLKKQNII